MVPARRAGSDRRPHRGRAAVPHLHVLDLHDRLRAGGDEGGARAVRRRRRLHERLAAARLDPALRLRRLPHAAAARHAGALGGVQPAHDRAVAPLRRPRQDEEAVAVLLREPRRRRALDRRPGVARRARRLVPVRQPGPRRRRHADLGLRDAGTRLPRRAAGQDGDQRHRRVVDRRAALAQRPQGDPRSAHVDERDGGLGDGAVSPHHRRRNRPRRGPARPRAGAPVLRLARAAPAALHQPPLHCVDRRRHGPARPAVPRAAGGIDDAAVPERPLSGAARRPLPVRLPARAAADAAGARRAMRRSCSPTSRG